MSDGGWNAETVRRAKVHAAYIGVIIFGTFLYIATKSWSTVPNLVDKVNFAAAMASVILAILAIVYAVWSNSTTSGSIASLVDVAEKIDGAVGGLQSILPEIRINVDTLANTATELNSRVGEHSDKLDSFFNQSKELREARSAAPTVEHNDAQAFLENSSVTGLVALLIACRSREVNERISLNEATKGLNYDIDYMCGYLICAASAGYLEGVSIWNESNSVKIERSNGFNYDDVKEALIFEGRTVYDSDNGEELVVEEEVQEIEKNLRRLKVL